MKVKEMVYKDMIYSMRMARIEILCEDEYKDYHFIISSNGSFPCAYVNIPRYHPYYKKDYDDLDIVVHGGLTYGKILTHIPGFEKNETNWYIGWDYAHAGDFLGGISGIDASTGRPTQKMWSVHEILSEVRFVIKQLIKVEKEAAKGGKDA